MRDDINILEKEYVSPSTLIRGFGSERDAGLNPTAGLDESNRLLRAVAKDPSIGRVVRLYRPAPTVAFSRREEQLSGFAEAVAHARAFGYEPVVRPAGGRMVALDTDWVVIDIITPESDRSTSHREIYERYGNSVVELLRELGVDAHFGPVPGEYCPGDYSVNARQEVKIVGTAQRVTRGARLFSASIPLAISSDTAQLFSRINGALELDWNPQTLGCLSAEVPGITFEALDAALITHLHLEDARVATIADIVFRASRNAA